MNEHVDNQSASALSGDGLFKAPLVSIIVTNFNYERFILECLESILAQTYERIECIVVDNCSTDGSVAVIRECIEKTRHKNMIRLLERDDNGGQMCAFKSGLQEAKGSFVVFVDADDTLFPDFVEAHVKAHLNATHPAALSCSNEIIIDEDGVVVSGSFRKLRPPMPLVQLDKDLPIFGTPVKTWLHDWSLAGQVAYNRPDSQLLYLAPSSNPTFEWIWTTTSAVMFRRSVLDLALTEHVGDIRICADFSSSAFAI